MTRPEIAMNTDQLNTALLHSRTPTIASTRRVEAPTRAEMLLAALLSLWPRRSHPPNVPDHLRADLGLGPEYRPQSWYEIELDALRRQKRKRPDHE